MELDHQNSTLFGAILLFTGQEALGGKGIHIGLSFLSFSRNEKDPQVMITLSSLFDLNAGGG